MSAIQFVTIWLCWGHTDGLVHVTLPSRTVDRVGVKRINALTIMKASVGNKRAVEDTVTDTKTDSMIIMGDLYFFKYLVTVAIHARHAKHVQRLIYYASVCV